MGHAATDRTEHRLKRLRLLLSDRPLTKKEVEARCPGIAPRTVHLDLERLLKRGDAVVVRSESRAQDTPRYVAGFRGIPVMEEVPGGLEIRRTFSGRTTFVSDAD